MLLCMRHAFISLKLFVSLLKIYGLAIDDVREIENTIMAAPRSSPVIPGTGGVRKMRLPHAVQVAEKAAVFAFVTFSLKNIIMFI